MSTNTTGYGWAGATYRAFRVEHAPTVDGHLDKPVWAAAPRTKRFVDIGTGGPALFDTHAAIVWDDSALYISFAAQDPHVTAVNTMRDSLVFFENDLEVFIDGGESYYELEFNAFGTVYEVFYIWRDSYQVGGKWDVPQFDVHSRRTHSFAGDHAATAANFWSGDHPRGTRWAFLDYDLPGLEVAVHVDGSINDPSLVDEGWSAEVRIPWSGLTDLAGGRSLPPRDGDTWSIFLGRFQQLATRDPAQPVSLGWAANAHGVNDTHIPESWTRVTFDTQLLDVEVGRDIDPPAAI
jgi:hypothetical protein